METKEPLRLPAITNEAQLPKGIANLFSEDSSMSEKSLSSYKHVGRAGEQRAKQ